MKRTNWFERKFDFNNLAGTFPSILERLRDVPLRLENKISHISSDNLVRKKGQSWSIQENIGHMLDLEPLWYGRVIDFENGEEWLRAADLENIKTQHANHNQREVGDLLADFSRERAKLVNKLGDLAPKAERTYSRHPRLNKPIRLIDLAYFVAEHDDHHLASISIINEHFLSHA